MRYYDTTTTKGLYRSRDGILAGVIGGIAEYFDVSAFWMRVLAVIAVLCTGFWPFVFCYGVAALLLKKDPYYSY